MEGNKKGEESSLQRKGRAIISLGKKKEKD